jgi:hypothetical protein
MKFKPTWAELRGTLLALLGVALTILFIAAGGAFWKKEYGLGILFLAVGSALAFTVFRKWKADLVVIGLIFIGINTGLTAVFHPSTPGMLITVGCGAGIVLLVRWMAGWPRTPQD